MVDGKHVAGDKIGYTPVPESVDKLVPDFQSLKLFFASHIVSPWLQGTARPRGY
jgi:hypothetical protein